jgi:hypothetical protein
VVLETDPVWYPSVGIEWLPCMPVASCHYMPVGVEVRDFVADDHESR